MTTVKVTVPSTKDMGSFSHVVSAGAYKTIAQNALWHYNSARAHDGLPPLRRMPCGTFYSTTAAVYVNRKDAQHLETVDEFETYKEARAMVKEYRISDPSAEYYLSSRPCKAWRVSR